jgi:hypothetical protein
MLSLRRVCMCVFILKPVICFECAGEERGAKVAVTTVTATASTIPIGLSYSVFLIYSVFVFSPIHSYFFRHAEVKTEARPSLVIAAAATAVAPGWLVLSNARGVLVCKWARKLVSRAYTHNFIYRPGPTIIFICFNTHTHTYVGGEEKTRRHDRCCSDILSDSMRSRSRSPFPPPPFPWKSSDSHEFCFFFYVLLPTCI